MVTQLAANIAVPYTDLRAFCGRHPVRRLALFGSVLRDDFGPDSDIDVLVEFEPDAGVTYFDLAGMRDELGELFGREIDLLTPSSLSPYFRDRVLSAAVTLYERK